MIVTSTITCEWSTVAADLTPPALRFDRVADQLYRQHLQMHQGYYFPLHDDYIELALPDEIEEEEVDEDEAVEEVS